MSFDYKKEYKEFYLPSKKPVVIDIPAMNFIAVQGKGNPNEPDGEYQQALQVQYALAYTLKMSYKGTYKMDGYFEYVVPPLEGLWWSDGFTEFDPSNKQSLHWISLIRLPDFVKEQDFQWAVAEAEQKKKLDCTKAEFFSYNEGSCVQCMHIGSYDDEPETIARMHSYVAEHGYAVELTQKRRHHEIYLSDPRKTQVDKLKTVIRLPLKNFD